MERTDTEYVDLESATRTRVLSAVSRYDLVLGVIPLALLTAAVGASVAGLPVEPLLAVGALVSLAAMVDALFVNPPRVEEASDGGNPPSSRRRRAS